MVQELIRDVFDKEHLIERCHVEEVVAAGASVIAATYSGVETGLTLETVASYNYGVNVGDRLNPIAKSNNHNDPQAPLYLFTETKDQSEL